MWGVSMGHVGPTPQFLEEVQPIEHDEDYDEDIKDQTHNDEHIKNFRVFRTLIGFHIPNLHAVRSRL